MISRGGSEDRPGRRKLRRIVPQELSWLGGEIVRVVCCIPKRLDDAANAMQAPVHQRVGLPICA